jgi:S-DNA-T family DNA segregation ATPase FtsK/SpoIIIE
MAAPPASRTRRKQGKTAQPLVSLQRKQEVLGLILMVLAFLLALAILTYDARDNALARNFSFDALLDPVENRAVNALGLVGAALSFLLVRGFLGYTTLFLPGLLFAWGYVLFRNRRALYLPLLSALVLTGTFLLATLFGWLATPWPDLGILGGNVGGDTADWMRRVFGSVGALVLILLVLAVTVLLVVDHDIQRSLDRAEDGVRAVRTWIQGWLHAGREKLSTYRHELAEHKAARQAARNEAPPPPTPPPTTVAPLTAVAASSAALPAIPEPIPATRAPVPRPSSDLFEAPPAFPAPPSPELRIQPRFEEEPADDLSEALHRSEWRLPFEMPSLDLLDAPDPNQRGIDPAEIEENKHLLIDTLSNHNIEITSVNAIVGPTVTLYELTPAPGVKISRITALEDDLAMALAARGIRMIAPIPGKSAVGVEIPNRHRELVRIREIIGTARFRDTDLELPLIIGKTIEGEVYLYDLTRMPHVLIAGATGSGKSVGLNTFITGLLYACPPRNLKFVLIDPKKVELQSFARLRDHYIAKPTNIDTPIITDFMRALGVLKSCEREMEQRYDLLSKARVRSVRDYNRKVAEGGLPSDEGHHHLPYIVVVVDELADLMMTAGKDIEGPIARLAQMARAVGIHLILATQRPSVDVITGLIKANFPARIAFQVASRIDSRIILDQYGAEGLIGNGDLLFMLGSRIMRLQGPFVSTDEIDRLTTFIDEQPGEGPYDLMPIEDGGDPELPTTTIDPDERDDLFEEAARIIVRSQQGSVSLLQRKLSIGYGRAARLVDQLEHAGIVGPFEGSKARQVLVSDEMDLAAFLK